jgi:hypothetical protein
VTIWYPFLIVFIPPVISEHLLLLIIQNIFQQLQSYYFVLRSGVQSHLKNQVLPLSYKVIGTYKSFIFQGSLLFHFFSVAQQPISGLGRLIVEVSTSHIITHTSGRTPPNEWSARRRGRTLPLAFWNPKVTVYILLLLILLSSILEPEWRSPYSDQATGQIIKEQWLHFQVG